MFQNATPRLTLLATIQQDIQMYSTKMFRKWQQLFAQGSWNPNIEQPVIKWECHPHPSIQDTVSCGDIPFLKVRKKTSRDSNRSQKKNCYDLKKFLHLLMCLTKVHVIIVRRLFRHREVTFKSEALLNLICSEQMLMAFLL